MILNASITFDLSDEMIHQYWEGRDYCFRWGNDYATSGKTKEEFRKNVIEWLEGEGFQVMNVSPMPVEIYTDKLFEDVLEPITSVPRRRIADFE